MSSSGQATPLKAHSIGEARCYLMVTACDRCTKGPWEMEPPTEDLSQTGGFSLRAVCKSCGREHTFVFSCPPPSPQGEDHSIIPISTPSKLVDLGQWLGLFHHLIAQGASQPAKDARQLGYQAALCLAEALKFYQDNELPPRSAFFSEATADAYRRHPEKYARQKLRDMQSKLPAPSAMARRIAMDAHTPKRKWWSFGRR